MAVETKGASLGVRLERTEEFNLGALPGCDLQVFLEGSEITVFLPFPRNSGTGDCLIIEVQGLKDKAPAPVYIPMSPDVQEQLILLSEPLAVIMNAKNRVVDTGTRDLLNKYSQALAQSIRLDGLKYPNTYTFVKNFMARVDEIINQIPYAQS